MAILTENHSPTWADRMRERGKIVSDARRGSPPPVQRYVAPKPTRVQRVLALLRQKVLDRLGDAGRI